MEDMINIETKKEGNTCTIFVSGVVDYSTMDPFIKEIRAVERGTAEVIVNFKGLEFIDSTGIGAIINLAHEANDKQFAVKLEGMSEETNELFDMIGVFQIMQTLQSEGQ
ncbi:STAS domain-containing protein [Oceanobacillus damuensis]|uniref:STAS domain-containing protein n=1 Tax=Oceanobacillus damuensis TaxID=937928 RepID=UPI00083737FD|nr:STAS domain-containing protein [Oceanobacillus damuensis]